MEGSQKGRGYSFPDITSRGSQTDHVSLQGWEGVNASLLNTGATPPRDNRSTRPIPQFAKAVTPPLRSRLLGSDANAAIPASTRKKRRTAPMSNRPCESPSIPIVPTQFDLKVFCCTCLPDPNPNYDKYNDDITIEPYTPSERTYSGKQRRGISETFPGASPHVDHTEAALAAQFPLHADIPPPTDLKTALEYNRDNAPEVVADFRTNQLNRLRIIAEECKHETERRYPFC